MIILVSINTSIMIMILSTTTIIIISSSAGATVGLSAGIAYPKIHKRISEKRRRRKLEILQKKKVIHDMIEEITQTETLSIEDEIVGFPERSSDYKGGLDTSMACIAL